MFPGDLFSLIAAGQSEVTTVLIQVNVLSTAGQDSCGEEGGASGERHEERRVRKTTAGLET